MRLQMIALSVLFFWSITLCAQQSTGFAIQGGADLTLGVQTAAQPGSTVTYTASSAGIYLDWKQRHLFPGARLGVDLRGQSATTQEQIGATLVGARLSGGEVFVPYAEVLVGPAHFQSALKAQDRHGTLLQGLFGVDLAVSPYLRWRVLEVKQSVFTGVAGSHPTAVGTGLVLHWP